MSTQLKQHHFIAYASQVWGYLGLGSISSLSLSLRLAFLYIEPFVTGDHYCFCAHDTFGISVILVYSVRSTPIAQYIDQSSAKLQICT